MTQIPANLPPVKEKEEKNQICAWCRKKSLQELQKMRINGIDYKFCPKCHEHVCANLVNKGGSQK